jgi:acyl carrier protein
MATEPVGRDATDAATHLLASALDIDIAEVSVDGRLGALRNWDSLGHARVVMAVEEMIGRELSTHEILDVVDFAAVVKLIGGTNQDSN